MNGLLSDTSSPLESFSEAVKNLDRISIFVGIVVGIVTTIAGRLIWRPIERFLDRQLVPREVATELEGIVTQLSDAPMGEWPSAFPAFLKSIRTWKTGAARTLTRGPRVIELCERIETIVELDVLRGSAIADVSKNVGGFLRVREAALELYTTVCEDAGVQPRSITTQVERAYLERLRRGQGFSRVAGECPHCHQEFECFQTAELAEHDEAICDQCQEQFSISEIPDRED
jgi:hypothetical protein